MRESAYTMACVSVVAMAEVDAPELKMKMSPARTDAVQRSKDSRMRFMFGS
jgi:hypothetical protein